MRIKKKCSEKEVVSQIKNQDLIEEKHELIFKAASELFSTKGYHPTTLRDISKESGINLSYLYKYISSKDDILYLFFQHLQREWNDIYEQLAEEGDSNPVDQMANFLSSMFDVMTKFKRQILTIFTESRHLKKDSLSAVLAKESRMVDCLEKLIIRGVKMGYFKTKDPFFVANMIHYLVPFYVLRGWNLDDQYTYSRIVELVQDFVFKALEVKKEMMK